MGGHLSPTDGGSGSAAKRESWWRAWGARASGRRHAQNGLPARLQRMGAAEFEQEVAVLLRGLGYAVRPTTQSSVPGVDLLLQGAGSRRVAVQLKRWNAPVGDRSVYALFIGRITHGTDEAWLITTSWFTPKAIKLAETSGVRLVDGAELATWLEDHPEASPEEPSPGSAEEVR